MSVEQYVARMCQLMRQKEELQREMLAMSYEFNATRPVNKLPIEILVDIFRYVQAIGYHGEKRSWYTVAAVCKHWRELANSSSCGSLWRQVAFNKSTELILSDVFFIGSGIPLLEGWGQPNFITNTIETSQGRARLLEREYQEVKAGANAYKSGPQFASVLEWYAPLVEVLEVDFTLTADQMDYPVYRGEGEAIPEIQPIRVNLSLFPRLQCLSLIAADLEFDPVPHPSIRKLHISESYWMDMSMDDFLVFISGCGSLEELRLHDFRPADLASLGYREDDGDTTLLTPVALPAHLRRLEIHDSSLSTARILRRLYVSQWTNLSLTIVGHASRDSDNSGYTADMPLYTALPSNTTHIAVLHCMNSIYVRFDRPTVYYIVALSSQEGHGSVRITADVPEKSHWESYRSFFEDLGDFNPEEARVKYRPDIFADLTKLFGRAPVAEITIVSTNPDRWKILSEADWAGMLQSFPLLKRLGVLFHSVQQAPRNDEDDPLMALVTALSDSRGDACQCELCPELECLTLHSSDVALDAETASRTNRIADCLRDRKIHGRALSHLRILLERDAHSVSDVNVVPTREERALLERYQSIFGPYVDLISCGDAVELQSPKVRG
ncbi:hypothetical protein GY45DRAFT_498717 [Cubamyces sp. BRFM 1775]|nr:hypothetical protein GY45DRAFT_498717 [Cubamyces sp. BRFM 1775]